MTKCEHPSYSLLCSLAGRSLCGKSDEHCFDCDVAPWQQYLENYLGKVVEECGESEIIRSPQTRWRVEQRASQWLTDAYHVIWASYLSKRIVQLTAVKSGITSIETAAVMYVMRRREKVKERDVLLANKLRLLAFQALGGV